MYTTSTKSNRISSNLPACGPGWEPIPIEDVNAPASTDPCAKIDSIKERASFRNAFTDLKNKTSEHKEYGYRVDDNNNDTTYYFIPGMPDEEDGVQWYFYDTVFFLLHSHFSGGLPIFSGGDFETIAALYDADFLNTEKFFFGVATETGAYILTIENPDKFELFREKYIDIENKSPDLEFKYKKAKIEYSTDSTTTMKDFVELMEHLDMGVSLLKANDDFTNFSKVSIVNNALKLTPCN